jgi:hypothetical protein
MGTRSKGRTPTENIPNEKMINPTTIDAVHLRCSRTPARSTSPWENT